MPTKSLSQFPIVEQLNISIGGTIQRVYDTIEIDGRTVSVRDTLIAMKKAVEIIKWKKFTDKKVFLAHLRKASERYKLTYFVSVRELAEVAYVTKETASKCNKRLEENGFLFVSKKHEKGTTLANQYTLTPFMRNTLFDTHIGMCITKEFSHNSDAVVQDVDSAIFDQPDTDYAFDIARNDCFRSGVSWVCDDTGDLVMLVKRVGGRCPEIFAELLHRQLQGVKEIAERIGCHPNVVRNALKKLMRHSLVNRTKTKRDGERCKIYIYYAPTNYDLHDAEIATHTFNKSAKVKKKHEEERTDYHDSLDDDEKKAQVIKKQREEIKRIREMLKEYSHNQKRMKKASKHEQPKTQ